MELGGVLRIVLVLVGIMFLLIAVNSLAQNKMTAPFCLTWGVLALVLVAAGIMLNPDNLDTYISANGFSLLVLGVLAGVYGVYFLSVKVSELMMKNTENSIQISLLREEKEALEKRLELLEKKNS